MIPAVSRRAFVALAGLAPFLSAARVRADSTVPAPDLHEVKIKGLKFNPDTLEVRVGDSIRWTNADLAPHTVTAKDKSWDSGRLKKGESATVEVKDGMTLDYVCIYHPHMKGLLILVA